MPGEENLDVVESLRNSSIELILTRHEQAAAFMAATHGRLTGRPGVCISTLGPGALNFTTGAAYALRAPDRRRSALMGARGECAKSALLIGWIIAGPGGRK